MAASARPGLALYPGTFDPFTYGHLDILRRACRLADRVEVTVAVNTGKEPLFTPDERCDLIRACIPGLEGVTVAAFDGLLVDRARARGATLLVRGLRQVSDFDYEFRMALANRRLYPELDTAFLMTSPEYIFLSASIVRDVHRWNGDLSAFVPPPVQEAMEARARPAS